jgi:hypothetical protein
MFGEQKQLGNVHYACMNNVPLKLREDELYVGGGEAVVCELHIAFHLV